MVIFKCCSFPIPPPQPLVQGQQQGHWHSSCQESWYVEHFCLIKWHSLYWRLSLTALQFWILKHKSLLSELKDEGSKTEANSYSFSNDAAPVLGNQAVSVCHSGSSVLGHVTLGHLERAGLVQQVVVVHAHVLFPGPGSWKWWFLHPQLRFLR